MKSFSLALVMLSFPALVWAGGWQRIKNTPPLPEIIDLTHGNADLGPGGASFPMLLTDGSVIIRNAGYTGADGKVFKLTPDINGSYVNGSWSELASMPYVGVDGAQAVLPDGRVIVEGGEYSNYELDFLLTNQGAIYDPVADSWTSVPPPPFFMDLFPPRATFAPNPIGDSQSVVLANGTFMLADKMSRQAALLDATNLTWTETGTATKADMNDEEGWTLLPDGSVLTEDCYTDVFFGLLASYPRQPTNSEIYDPSSGQWHSGGSTLKTLTDPILSETGAQILRPNGTVFAVGSKGFTAIYHTDTHRWTAGPRLPRSPQHHQYTMQDGPGALLPDGNVLIAVSGGPAFGSYSNPPVAFFEFDGSSFLHEPSVPNAGIDVSGSLNLLVLPTGQILATDSSSDVEVYTSADARAHPEWAPTIINVPTSLTRGQTGYILSGTRLNGMSQASAFGDENQNATNYPLLRITMKADGHVFYSRTHDFSSMAVASNAIATMEFDVPAGQETGLGSLVVVTNGLASPPVTVSVN